MDNVLITIRQVKCFMLCLRLIHNMISAITTKLANPLFLPVKWGTETAFNSDNLNAEESERGLLLKRKP